MVKAVIIFASSHIQWEIKVSQKEKKRPCPGITHRGKMWVNIG